MTTGRSFSLSSLIPRVPAMRSSPLLLIGRRRSRLRPAACGLWPVASILSPVPYALVALVLLAVPAAAQTDGLPLTPARTAKFTTSKGSWMSLDVSPDGRTLVFDLLGDLYSLPITGGKATRLTSGIAYD